MKLKLFFIVIKKMSSYDFNEMLFIDKSISDNKTLCLVIYEKDNTTSKVLNYNEFFTNTDEFYDMVDYFSDNVKQSFTYNEDDDPDLFDDEYEESIIGVPGMEVITKEYKYNNYNIQHYQYYHKTEDLNTYVFYKLNK